ncbi:MAG TPA: phasin family protein, partial [Acetobacteraceae bacterium]|nr:phasin family protein [Acetobacteraceae bacterium]
MAVRTKTEELVGATPEAVDTGYQAGSAAYQQGVKAIEQTVSTLKDGMAQATAGFEKTQTRVKAGMDKAMQTAEEFVAFGQGNLEALVKSGQIWTSGVQDLGKQVAATAQASFEET